MTTRVSVYREWPDGDKLQFVIDVETSYPDALHEAKRTVLDGYAEALGITLYTGEDDDGLD